MSNIPPYNPGALGRLGGAGGLNPPTGPAAPTSAPAPEGGGRSPIGVVPGYSPYSYQGEDRNIFRTQPNPATNPADAPFNYFTGDELLPRSWPRERIVQLQQQLEQAGILERPYQIGIWDDESVKAYKAVLGYANARGTGIDEVIGLMSEAIAKYGNTSSASQKAQPLQITLTNPADIASLANNIAVRTIGRRLTEQEASTLAQSYNAMERQFQEQNYAQRGSGLSDNATGGTITQPQNPSVYAEDTIRAQNPEEATEMSYIHNVDAFRDLLSSARARVNSLG